MKRTIEQDFILIYLSHLGYPPECLAGIIAVLDRYRPYAPPPKRSAKVISFLTHYQKQLMTREGGGHG